VDLAVVDLAVVDLAVVDLAVVDLAKDPCARANLKAQPARSIEPFASESPWFKVSQDRLKTFDLAWSFQVLCQPYFFRDYPRFLRIGLLSDGRIIAWWLGW
jgi:hypothetical protein